MTSARGQEQMDQSETESSVRVGAAAPDVTLQDADGAERSLSSYWVAQPTVLVFVRHFG